MKGTSHKGKYQKMCFLTVYSKHIINPNMLPGAWWHSYHTPKVQVPNKKWSVFPRIFVMTKGQQNCFLLFTKVLFIIRKNAYCCPYSIFSIRKELGLMTTIFCVVLSDNKCKLYESLTKGQQQLRFKGQNPDCIGTEWMTPGLWVEASRLD